MGNYHIDPKKQFSKRLARWTAVFWFFYMTWLSTIMLLQPQAALYTVYMGIIVTVVMILNIWAYTKNSIYEKGAYALLDKTRIELGLGSTNQTTQASTNTGPNDIEEETDHHDDGEVIEDEHSGEG